METSTIRDSLVYLAAHSGPATEVRVFSGDHFQIEQWFENVSGIL
jgi:hypothetical protein